MVPNHLRLCMYRNSYFHNLNLISTDKESGHFNLSWKAMHFWGCVLTLKYKPASLVFIISKTALLWNEIVFLQTVSVIRNTILKCFCKRIQSEDLKINITTNVILEYFNLHMINMSQKSSSTRRINLGCIYWLINARLQLLFCQYSWT